MPIPVQCTCGLAMEAPDEMAGQHGECPECKAQFLVPAPAAAPAATPAAVAPAKQRTAKKKKQQQKQKQARKGQSKAAAKSDPADMNSLLDEVGVQKAAGRNSCPNCRASVDPEATICIHCGMNQESGKQVKQKLYGSAGGGSRAPSKWDDPKVKYGTLLLVALVFIGAIYFVMTKFG